MGGGGQPARQLEAHEPVVLHARARANNPALRVGRFKKSDEQIKARRAQATGRQIPIEPDDYAKRGAMYLLPESRYDFLVELLEDEANIGKCANDAMAVIEKVSPQLAGVLPHDYTELGSDLLREMLRIFNNPALDEGGDDILRCIHEYFLGKFETDKAYGNGIKTLGTDGAIEWTKSEHDRPSSIEIAYDSEHAAQAYEELRSFESAGMLAYAMILQEMN